jgi:soluble lytic murein transglycosylase-like protein
MELIIENLPEVSLTKSNMTKVIGLILNKEFKLITLFIIMFSAGIYSYPHLHQVSSLATVKSLSTNSNQKIILAQKERINLKEIVTKTMSYSYEDTQLGFYLKNLVFFDLNSKLAAEDKMLAALPKSLSVKAKKYLRAVFKISENHQVDPVWILSVMWTESCFDYSAKSWAGARGLMQIMPATRKFIYRAHKAKGHKLVVEQQDFNINEYFPYKVKKNDIKEHQLKLVNIELGVIYLKTLLLKFKNHKHATVAYNMGPGWTRGRLRRNLPVGQKNEYLDKVRKAYKRISRKI